MKQQHSLRELTMFSTQVYMQGYLSDALTYEPHRHVGWLSLGLLKAQT